MTEEEKDKVLILIDSDGLLYHSSRETLNESIEVLNAKIQNIYEKTGATHSCFFISKGKYFRHTVSNDYKQSRGKYPTKLLWLKTLKSYLEDNYQASHMYLVEADDLVAYWYQNIKDVVNIIKGIQFDKIILISADKDLLLSIEGKHFNYTYKLEDKSDINSIIKGWWVTTTEEEARQFSHYQMIVGG